MTKEERVLFEALKEARSETERSLQVPSVKGIWRDLIAKYTDAAHFVYELLQNADDARATTVRFILDHDRLVFIHNGTRHFSISDPDSAKEESDAAKGRLGDINSITSVANSSKNSDEKTVGMFGVGFKSVFQYTSTPSIYDNHFWFRIERYMVPVEIEEDFPGRAEDETVFVFPFDYSDQAALQGDRGVFRSPKEAYEDISRKLKSLNNPLLFLSHLTEIDYRISDTVGSYKKEIEKTKDVRGIDANRLCLIEGEEGQQGMERLWLFSKNDGLSKRYSVGFFLDEDGHLCAVKKAAFSYFQTREVTNLNFIIHAPFHLTNNREGIVADDPYNITMINSLASLAAESLVILRDIGIEEENPLINDSTISSIIPLKEDEFVETGNGESISFRPFYDSIRRKFQYEKLFRTATGYVEASNGCWATVPQLSRLFSDDQLQQVIGDSSKRKKWILLTLSRSEMQRAENPVYDYINGLSVETITEDDFLGDDSGHRGGAKGITETFIKNQTVEWLHRFYKWLSETDKRRDYARYKPYFLDQKGDAAQIHKTSSADSDMELFLPPLNSYSETENWNYKTVNEKLLENEETLEFIKSLGIKEYSARDYIYNYLIPRFKGAFDWNQKFSGSGSYDMTQFFMPFFECYCNCCEKEPQTVGEYVSRIRELAFIQAEEQDSDTIYFCKGEDIFFPYDDLKRYYAFLPSTKFLRLDQYESEAGDDKKTRLLDFFKALGVRERIILEKRVLTSEEVSAKRIVNMNYLPVLEGGKDSTARYTEPYFYGCLELLDYIAVRRSMKASLLLWEILCSLRLHDGDIDLGKGQVSYRYYKDYVEDYEPEAAIRLRTEKWLFDKEGDQVSANDTSVSELADEYMAFYSQSKELIEFLQFRKSEDTAWLDSLTKEQRALLDIGQLLKKQNINIEDLTDESVLDGIKDLIRKKNIKKDSESRLTKAKKEAAATDGNGALDGQSAKKNASGTKQSKKRSREIDYDKIIDEIKDKSNKEIKELEQRKQMEEKIQNMDPYSYGWFMELLELELLDQEAEADHNKEFSIKFLRAELEPNRERTIVLKRPNRYIPQFIEELSDICLELTMRKKNKTVNIEVVSVRNFTLRAKLKQADELKGIDLSSVTEANITIKDPSFLLEKLIDCFSQLELQDDYDMKKNLPKNMEFIFGPPGTGKTTYLAKNVLLPKMVRADLKYMRMKPVKVLVLTPTNKAADVLVRRIMEIDDGSRSYLDWLIRFGGTDDEVIEKSPVFSDRILDREKWDRCITVVTTIARFPYDFFLVDGKIWLLRNLGWDYVVFDEASMIPLANIVYPLFNEYNEHREKPKQFIIAGDPFQIEPIVNEELWKGENIYKMVQLNSFEDPQTEPHDYDVKLLTTQYRSIPSVGELFSRFMYGGILEHNRSETERRIFNLKHDLLKYSLNIIRFPVQRYESIYRPKRLQNDNAVMTYANQKRGGSPYQIYSALFIFEYVSFLAEKIAESNPGEEVSIGIISPYRAQADMMDKLFATRKQPDGIHILAGTVHGFQGDECDIMFAVFNPPPLISAEPEMFLNNRNIINVAISRARDYLFIVMPDKDTKDIDNLVQVNSLARTVQEIIQEKVSVHTRWLEEKMFGQNDYLEKNVFSTGHQSVNVYGHPENLYEIRTEKTAVDIQIHSENKNMDKD